MDQAMAVPGAVCASHLSEPLGFNCERCGGFACERCRALAQGAPRCAACVMREGARPVVVGEAVGAAFGALARTGPRLLAFAGIEVLSAAVWNLHSCLKRAAA